MTAYKSEQNGQFPSFRIHLSNVGGLSITSEPPGSHSFAQTNFNPKRAHMSCCTASFKELYLQLGNIGHGGTIKTNFIPLFTAHCDVLGSALGGGALPLGPPTPFLLHLPSPRAADCGGETPSLFGTGGVPSTLEV